MRRSYAGKKIKAVLSVLRKKGKKNILITSPVLFFTTYVAVFVGPFRLLLVFLHIFVHFLW